MPQIVRVAAVLVLAVALYLLLGPATRLENGAPGVDKLAHFLAFGAVLWALGVLFRRVPRLTLAGVALAFGGLTELVQHFIGRDAEVLDLVADALGIAVALLVWATWRRFKPRAELRMDAALVSTSSIRSAE